MRIISLVVVLAACGQKVDLAKVKEVYARWETGWQDARPCLFGKIERTADPRVQIELAQLFHERPACPSWLNDPTDKLPALSVSQLNKKAREKELDEKANAINVWTLLEAGDLTDDLANDSYELVKAIKAFQALPLGFDDKHIDTVLAIAAARDKLRKDLGLAADSPGIGRDTPVTALAPKPAAPAPPPALDAALLDSWRAAAKDTKDWSEPRALADKAEPVVWIAKGDMRDADVRVFQQLDGKWKETKLAHVAYLATTPHRLDVVFRAQAPASDELETPNAKWIWFGPNHRDPVATKLLNWGEIHWMCSSESFLWLSAEKESATLGRMRLGTDQLAETVEAAGIGGGECDDAAVSSADGLVLCTLSAGCRANPYHGQLLDGQIVGIEPGATLKDGQLLVMRSGKKERVLRLPPGSAYSLLGIRDRKPVITLAGGGTAAAPVPGGNEPIDYKCGGDDRVIPRVGCKCPAGQRPARTRDNVAICEPGEGAAPAAPGGGGAMEVVLPWPI